MRLRIGSTELTLFVAGLIGLIEQEIVRVTLHIDPSTIISGVCFAFVLLGAGFTLGRNFRIGPVEVEMKEPEPAPGPDSEQSAHQRDDAEESK